VLVMTNIGNGSPVYLHSYPSLAQLERASSAEFATPCDTHTRTHTLRHRATSTTAGNAAGG